MYDLAINAHAGAVKSEEYGCRDRCCWFVRGNVCHDPTGRSNILPKLAWCVTQHENNKHHNTAYDLGACMRNAFLDMPIAEEPFREGVEILKERRKQAIAEQRALVGSPVVVVVAGVTIIMSEIVFEAGAVTVLFAVTVKVVEKAAEDVENVLKRRPPIADEKDECVDGYERCILSGGGVRGNNWNTTV